ncbi:hypothetical protein Aconfl_25020 [Algoriphagus confluentis]|uniref:Uncharacterized protein n=1 Tax=Algoriphagus confluentis TaxID=1697556 RepID=A0ABQ6PPH8_9BACT|nr:hypothetical protein Aconfl_25020 [Algoriphagus confluentis]
MLKIKNINDIRISIRTQPKNSSLEFNSAVIAHSLENKKNLGLARFWG